MTARSAGGSISPAESRRYWCGQGAPRGVLLELPGKLAIADVNGIHLAAPCCSRQSVKPPVEAPTSRHTFPATGT